VRDIMTSAVKDISDQKFIIEQLEHPIAGDWGLNAFGGE